MTERYRPILPEEQKRIELPNSHPHAQISISKLADYSVEAVVMSPHMGIPTVYDERREVYLPCGSQIALRNQYTDKILVVKHKYPFNEKTHGWISPRFGEGLEIVRGEDEMPVNLRLEHRGELGFQRRNGLRGRWPLTRGYVSFQLFEA